MNRIRQYNVYFKVVDNGEALLEKIQKALSDIAQAQLDMQQPSKDKNK